MFKSIKFIKSGDIILPRPGYEVIVTASPVLINGESYTIKGTAAGEDVCVVGFPDSLIEVVSES